MHSNGSWWLLQLQKMGLITRNNKHCGSHKTAQASPGWESPNPEVIPETERLSSFDLDAWAKLVNFRGEISSSTIKIRLRPHLCEASSLIWHVCTTLGPRRWATAMPGKGLWSSLTHISTTSKGLYHKTRCGCSWQWESSTGSHQPWNVPLFSARKRRVRLGSPSITLATRSHVCGCRWTWPEDTHLALVWWCEGGLKGLSDNTEHSAHKERNQVLYGKCLVFRKQKVNAGIRLLGLKRNQETWVPFLPF